MTLTRPHTCLSASRLLSLSGSGQTPARSSVKATRTTPLKMNGLTLENGTFIVTSKNGLNCFVVELGILQIAYKNLAKILLPFCMFFAMYLIPVVWNGLTQL